MVHWVAHGTFVGGAGPRAFILIHGSNLMRNDLRLEYRLSPVDYQISTPAALLDPHQLQEWGVSYLMEHKAWTVEQSQNFQAFHFVLNKIAHHPLLRVQDSLAVLLPEPIIRPDASSMDAKDLVLDLWRGTVCFGSCRLPVAGIRQAI